MANLNEQIVTILCRHIGKKNAIVVEKIAIEVGLVEGNGKTYPATRAKIKDLISKLEIPIGSCSRGYFIIASDDEMEAFEKNILGRMAGMQKRLDDVKHGYRKWGKQLAKLPT